MAVDSATILLLLGTSTKLALGGEWLLGYNCMMLLAPPDDRAGPLGYSLRSIIF